MKVFISSVIRGFEAEREAASQAAQVLNHDVIVAEAFGARAESPQRACLQGVRDADVVVLLLGALYGAVQSSGLSATHEEYREAASRSDVLAFVQEGVTFEPREQEFVGEVRAWMGGRFTGSFRGASDLRNAVTRALHDHELAQMQGRVDVPELVGRAKAAVPKKHELDASRLVLVVAGGPPQSVVRPADIEGDTLARWLTQTAISGPYSIFEIHSGTDTRLRDGRLVLTQPDATIALRGDGTIVITMPDAARRRSERNLLPALVEEDVTAKIARALRLTSTILDHIDPLRRLRRVAPVAALVASGWMGWRTQREYESTGGSGSMGQGREEIVVALTPPDRARPALDQQADSLAEDLMVLLRREVRGA